MRLVKRNFKPIKIKFRHPIAAGIVAGWTPLFFAYNLISAPCGDVLDVPTRLVSDQKIYENNQTKS
jgi:hypothetical protein